MKMKVPRNRLEFEKNKKHFNEYTLEKRHYSVPRQIMIIVKPRKNWYEGININSLRKRILDNFKKLPRRGTWIRKIIKRGITKATIYTAIRDLNLYGSEHGIFIVSRWGIDTEKGIKEFRYFCPYEPNDISKQRELFFNSIFRNQLKGEQLEVFEEEIKHEQEVQIMTVENHNPSNSDGSKERGG